MHMQKKLLILLWLVLPEAIFATGNTIALLGKRPAPESAREDRNQDERAASTSAWLEYDAHQHTSVEPQNIFHDYNQVTHRESYRSYAFIDENGSAQLPVRIQVAEQNARKVARKKEKCELDLTSPLVCPHCKQEFDRADQKLLADHMKHEHRDRNTHFCFYLDSNKQRCNKRYSSEQKLTEHENGHIGKRPYFCKYCYVNTTWSRDMVRHVQQSCIKKFPASKEDYLVINEATNQKNADGILWYLDPFSKATRVSE